MNAIAVAILLSAGIPLLYAVVLNRGATIVHALVWALFAWLGWLWAALAANLLSIYAALTLTGSAGIAVLGARRPGLVAWNFIVATLLIVLWLGWAEGLLAGAELKLGWFRLSFLGLLLGLTVMNYLPTRLGCAALCLGAAATILFINLTNHDESSRHGAAILAGIAPWLAWLQWRLHPIHGTPTDRSWLWFRDRYGVVWAQRLREQFNRAAANNNWPVELGWFGLQPPTTAVPKQWHDAMIALQKRFHTESGSAEI